MRKIEPRLAGVRMEIVTTAFVASGEPDGIHDLGRLIENLNSTAIGRQIELKSPSIRPLYRSTTALELDAPLLVRREDIVFVDFEGPHFKRGSSPPTTFDVPVLLMAPPFQIQGVFAVQQDAEITQALRSASQGFFVLKDTRVFDAEGASLGDGDRIVVNGAAVQMMSATRQHISVIGAVPSARRAEDDAGAETAPVTEQTRAA